MRGRAPGRSCAEPVAGWAAALAIGLIAQGLACTSFQLAMREAGEFNKTMPAEVAREYHCAKRELPFFALEESELLPERAMPGDELNHRIVYVMCPDRPTAVVRGKLDSRILFKGEVIFREVISQELKPGRWIVDTFIPLPSAAEAGVYALEVEFVSTQGRLTERKDFIVVPPKQ